MIKKLFRKRELYNLPLTDRKICSQYNLVNCMAGINVKGSCCVRNNDCEHPDKKAIKDVGGICFNCVNNVTQCECAKLNKVNNCNDIIWSAGLTCDNVPCGGSTTALKSANTFIKPLAPLNHFQISPIVRDSSGVAVNGNTSTINSQIAELQSLENTFTQTNYKDALDLEDTE